MCRALASVVPPGDWGTTKVTGLLGQACADATPTYVVSTAAITIAVTFISILWSGFQRSRSASVRLVGPVQTRRVLHQDLRAKRQVR